MAGQGSTGNVLAAVCSFFIPGLGQLVQGRPIKALVHCVIGVALWFIFLGWLMHCWSALEAALWKPKETRGFAVEN
jgi:TM2 domain-containing membrane protein YozV